MHITQIDLENIKSYRRETVHLAEGLNAICGLNGSGKTTVLESIGFALFDHLPYSQQSFVREGEKTGTVRVRLMVGDGREYEVVRKVGSSSQYYVADVESGTRLAERRDNVLEWIRTNALGIEGEADLQALFKNAVGVPQGLMTSDFINPAATRKKIFDPLLRVEEYEKARAELRETINNVRDRTATVREEIARLEVEVEKIPGLVEQETVLNDQVQTSEAGMARIASDLEQVEGQKAALDTMQATVTAVREEQAGREHEVKLYTDRLSMQQTGLDAALAARQAVTESEEGYRAVEAARRELSTLEARRKDREVLSHQQTRASTGALGTQRRIEQLDAELRRAIEDGDKAAALDPDVVRQDELDAALNGLAMRVQEGKRLDAELLQIDSEIVQLQDGITQRAQRLAGAAEAQREALGLEDVQREQQEVVGRLATLESLKGQLRDVRAEGERLRQDHDRLQEDVRRRTELRQAIDAKRPLAAELETLQRRERELREETIRAQATLEYQNVARTDLERETCPLLELRCPVVASDMHALDRFDARVTDLAERIGSADAELSTVEARLTLAGVAAQELQRLEVDAARLERSEVELAAVVDSLARCRAQYQQLATALAEGTSLERKQRELGGELKRLQNASKLAAQISVLKEQQEKDTARLADRETARATLAETRAKVAEAEAEARRLDAELKKLDDPRRRQHALLAAAARKPDLERQLEQEQARLQEESDRLRAVIAALQAFRGLDEAIEEQHRIEHQHQAAYEMYLRHRDEASQVEARRQAHTQTSEALRAARAAETETRERLAQAEASYDGELHERLKAQARVLGDDLAAAGARHEELLKKLAEIEGDLAYYRRQEEKLRRQEEERGELERTAGAVRFIRDTIKAAGPAITETLLANISQVANDIYAEIMDDHAVELRWDRDYEVLVRRGPEDRQFSQLSGGEQMSAALAVRLALLKEMSDVDVAFFDEPTQNMDADRRGNLADQIQQVRGFNQLIVISHDDTFEHHTDNLIRLVKDEDETRIETGS